MFNISKAQTLTLTGILVLTVLLFIANTKPSPETPEVSVSAAGKPGVERFIESARAALNEQQRAGIAQLESELSHATDDQKTLLLDSLMESWKNFQKPVPAAWYAEKIAVLEPSPGNWEKAGNYYLAATRFMQPEERSTVFQRAISCYEKAIVLNPGNTDARINLAACYVEGTSDPMKGIGMLKEIEQTDSNNIRLQLNFAMFSEKSGQFEKAIQRYNKVLRIDSTYIEAYLHLADAFENMNEKKQAIRSLEKYLRLVNDPTIRTEVQNYINKLSNS